MSELDNSLLMLELRRQKHELNLKMQDQLASLKLSLKFNPSGDSRFGNLAHPHCSYCGMSHSTDGRCTSCGAPVSRPVILPKSHPCY